MSSIFDTLRGDGEKKWDELTIEERAEKNKSIIENLDSEIRYLKKRLDELNHKLESLTYEEREDEDTRSRFLKLEPRVEKMEYKVQRNENNIKQLYKQLNLKQYF